MRIQNPFHKNDANLSSIMLKEYANVMFTRKRFLKKILDLENLRTDAIGDIDFIS